MEALNAAEFHLNLRLAGAVIWTLILTCLAAYVTDVSPLALWGPHGVLGRLATAGLYTQTFLVFFLQAPLLFLHWVSIRVHEPEWQVHLPRPQQVLARALLREATLSDTLLVAGRYLLSILVGMGSLGAVTTQHSAAVKVEGAGAWFALCGAVLGLVHTGRVMIEMEDVVVVPAVAYSRTRRIRLQLPRLAAAALKEGVWTLALCLLPLLPIPGMLLPRPPSAAAVAAAGLCCSMVSLAWGAAVLMAGGACSERFSLLAVAGAEMQPMQLALSILDPPPEKPKGGAAGSRRASALLQHLVLQDLCCSCEAAEQPLAWACSAVFSDASGAAAWAPVAKVCMKGVLDTLGRAAAQLPSAAPLPAAAPRNGDFAAGAGRRLGLAVGEGEKAGTAAGAAGGGVSWNEPVSRRRGHPRLASAGLHEDAIATIQSRYMDLQWQLRTLASLATAARREDRFGVLVRLSKPGLAEVLLLLLSAQRMLHLLLRHLLGQPRRSRSTLSRLLLLPGTSALTTAISPGFGSQAVSRAVMALSDVASACCFQLVDEYGSSLVPLLREADPSFSVAGVLQQDIHDSLQSMLKLHT